MFWTLRAFACALFVLLLSCAVFATEPNETFLTATEISPGVLSVFDDLTPGTVDSPDTYLGVRNDSGIHYAFDNNSSPYGDGNASSLERVPTNSGSISFSITGYPDTIFTGAHSQFGEYTVLVDVYDFFGEFIETIEEDRLMQPGGVDHFMYPGTFEWNGGDYDVFIDNFVGPAVGGDVDFFTFTGLTPGSGFAAQTYDPSASEIDTFLGWFDDSGALLVSDDDSAGGFLSLINGVVPASGRVTLAVTGYEDDLFTGGHLEGNGYELRLTLSTAKPGDFDFDGDVDGADFVAWRTNFPKASGATLADGDADGDGDVDGADFVVWQTNFPFTPGPGAAPVPEPTAFLLAAIAIPAIAFASHTRRPGRLN